MIWLLLFEFDVNFDVQGSIDCLLQFESGMYS